MLKGKRTIIFNAVMGLVLLYNVVVPDAPAPSEAEVGTFVDQVIDHADALITIGGNIWLRFVTTSPIFKKA